ncbi:hypothetical protein J8F10_29980 [Gemmata sp. G18]|uniref:Carboxypeptidase regulatory-like domain-containing protein n=1 Tax=Gemmata palustris TaxID=2822762 RepID=A0ABS5C0L2_9BACT|nr:hypothetical protein [Gemmata palustris]MBP3959494.1 hypothetical protein [Gemmata palustris]
MRSFRQASGSSANRFRARLSLEALDSRLAPSSLLDDSTQGVFVLLPAPVIDPANVIAVSSAPLPGATADPTLVRMDADATQEIYAPVTAVNVAPRIINFKGVEAIGGVWRFSGDVIGPAPAGLVIQFGGVPATLQNKATTTDATGHFSVTYLMKMDGTDNGLASAKTTDANGLASNLALYNISPG